jgi:DNA polymerase V
MKRNVIFCIDFKSFYASCECIDRGLNPYTTKLVVADKTRGEGTIVLAVSPFLKTFGVPSRLRVFELPKDDEIIFAKPRMSRYLEMSSKAISIFLDYVNKDDLHVYSVDESFLNITPYLKMYNYDEISLAKKIKNRIHDELGLDVTIGIGPNLFLAKVALDNEAKNNQDQIPYWNEDDIKTKLHKITPLSKIWSIGSKTEKKLNKIGIYNLGYVSNTPKEILLSSFGILGGELHDHSNGIDTSDIRDKYVVDNHSLTVGQVLFKDYSIKDIPILIREMLDDLMIRLRQEKSLTKKVSLSIRYSKEFNGGFSRQTQLIDFTDDVDLIYESMLFLFDKFKQDLPVRALSLSLGNLISINHYQPSLFEDISLQERKRKLMLTLDNIKKRFGNNSIFRCDQLLESSNALERHNRIGGHAR